MIKPDQKQMISRKVSDFSDIANYIGKVSRFSSSELFQIKEKVSKQEFTFTRKSNSYKCQQSWFQRYDWLTYSYSLELLFCVPCFLMGGTIPKKSKLATEGLQPSKSITSKLKEHALSKNHKNSIDDFQNLQHAVIDPKKSIDVTVNKIMENQIKRNRSLIKPIIATIIVLGKQNIPLRGHRDDSKYYLSNEYGIY